MNPLIALFSIIFQSYILNRIAKLAVLNSILFALIRTSISFLYIDIFKNNDILVFYFPSIEQCKDTVNIFNFKYLASFLYCNNLITELRNINMIYGCVGVIAVAVLINLGRKIIKKNFYFDYQKSLNKFISIPFNKSFNLIKLLFLLDPSCLSYTSVFSKDLFTFFLIVLFIYLLYYPNRIIAFLFIILSLINLISRPYILIFLFIACLTIVLRFRVSIHGFIKKIKFNNPFNINYIYSKNTFILYLFLFPTFIIGFYFAYTQFYSIFSLPGFGLENDTNFQTILNVLEAWKTSDMGGNLSFPNNLPIPIKYLFFWILPIPIFQPGFGAIIFGISTLINLFIIFNILKKGLDINSYLLNIILSLILITSISFSIISSNSGITTRYRFTICMPPLFVLYIISDLQYYKKKFMKLADKN